MMKDDRCRWCGKALLPIAPGADGIAGNLRDLADEMHISGILNARITLTVEDWENRIRALADRLAAPAPPAE